MVCEECLSPVMDDKACSDCGDVVCQDCRYYSEGIIYCFECFIELRRQYEYEMDEW
jgi:hypothetical protein